MHYHSYVDDSMREALLKLESCIKEISHWMSHSGLKLNENKTEWIIFNRCDISETVTLTVGAHSITQSTHIRSLGVRLDAELTIEPQITDMCKTA